MKKRIVEFRGNVWVTADWHLGHRRIIQYCHRNSFLCDIDKAALEAAGGRWHRGSWKGEGSSRYKISDESVKIMDDTIIDNTNSLVGEDDILINLGDVALPSDRRNYYEIVRRYLGRINCKRKFLIWGNHDGAEIKDLFQQTWDKISLALIDKQYFSFDHTVNLIWFKNHRHCIHLYGHSHSNAESWCDQHMPGRRSMDVGVDQAYKLFGEYRPFSIKNDIMKIMSEREGFSMDHHIPKNSPYPEEEELDAN